MILLVQTLSELTLHGRSCAVHDQSDDKAVKTQDFGENENENHSDEESWLLSSTPDTSVTDDTNSKAGSKTCETNGETSTKLDEASSKRHMNAEVTSDEDGNDESVDGNDTSHDDGYDTLHHKVWAKDGHG